MRTVKKSKLAKKPAPKAKLPKTVRCPVCLQEVKTQDLRPVAAGNTMSFGACKECVAEIRRTIIAHALALAQYNVVPQTSAVRLFEVFGFPQIAKEVPPASVAQNPFLTMFSAPPEAAQPKPTTGAAPACPDCVVASTTDGEVPPEVEVKSGGNGNPSA